MSTPASMIAAHRLAALSGAAEGRGTAARVWRVRRSGRLQVQAGAVWLTRHGEPGDQRLARGESLRLARGERVTIGPWQDGEAVAWSWAPETAPGAPAGQRRVARLAAGVTAFFAAALAEALGAAAATLARGAARARSAAASASRAQGCIA